MHGNDRLNEIHTSFVLCICFVFGRLYSDHVSSLYWGFYFVWLEFLPSSVDTVPSFILYIFVLKPCFNMPLTFLTHFTSYFALGI